MTIANSGTATGNERRVDSVSLGRLLNMSMSGFQGLNAEIYLEQNDRHYGDTWRMISRMHRYVTNAGKGIRVSDTRRSPSDLCLGASWGFAFANRLHINVELELLKKYPGVCHYCASIPCIPECNSKMRSLDPKAVASSDRKAPATMREIQDMLAAIYPNNELSESMRHLTEELGELHEAYEHFSATHDVAFLEEIKRELVDVFAHIFAVNTLLGRELASDMAMMFATGCPGCRKPKCKCDYTAYKMPPIRGAAAE